MPRPACAISWRCAATHWPAPARNTRRIPAATAMPPISSPAWLADRFDGLDNDAATRKLIAAAVAAEQVLDLVDHGVTDFHFYTMNRADLVFAICHLLGGRPNIAPGASLPL